MPQFYLRNFTADGKVFVLRTKDSRLFRTSPRNIAGERDLYKLEGPEPQLAEELFGQVESSLTPILSKIISTESLPPAESDDFVSLMSFLAILEMRHPKQLNKIEDFTKKIMERTVELYSHYIPEEGKKLIDGQVVTRDQVKSAVAALNEGRIKIHVPRDHSLSTSLNTIETITELLMNRSWTLAIAEENSFITTSKPLLLLWDDIELHLRHPAGFGMKSTTVYFPLSPRLMMIGKFETLKEKCNLDSTAVAAINGFHGIFWPSLFVAQDDSNLVQMGSAIVPFKELPQAIENLPADEE